MSGIIYLIGKDNKLIEMREEPYDSEDLLQRMLVDYPNLLAGDQIDSDSPRRWLLINREVPLPDHEDGSGRWSVDHLFLDQDGTPTIVEVKRSSDTRIRREVIGQMLDYAANAIAYWSIDAIKAQYELQCGERDSDPNVVLADFLDPDADVEVYWQQVKTNLQAGKIRMVFVADEIPAELRRIVEFLNKQMDPAEVLAIEVKQFTGEGVKTLVPRALGSQKEKPGISGTGTKWTEERFFSEIERIREKHISDIARAILNWSEANSLRIWWGMGKSTGSFMPMFDYADKEYWTVWVGTNGRIQIQFGMMKTRPPFDGELNRIELLNRLNIIEGLSLPSDSIDKYPGFDMDVLNNEESLKQFLDTFKWYIEFIRQQ